MKEKRMWGALLHLGSNMWSDKPYPPDPNAPRRYKMPENLPPEVRRLKLLQRTLGGVHDHLRFDQLTWNAAVEYMRTKRLNFLVVDIGEGVRLPSHPEIAAKDAWTPEKMYAEVKRLAAMGIELIPKMNFSTTHCAWMREYRRQVSTERYYQFCEDVIKDVCEIFGKPRLMHLGYDEEDYDHMRNYEYVTFRQGDLWWHDFLFTVRCVEKLGMRAWVWSDKIWHHREEFVKRMPRSVLQSNWYYLDDFAPEEKSELYPMVHAYEWLDQAGFEQIPCVSNCGHWNTLKTNPKLTAEYCRKHVAPERLKGMMFAAWCCTTVDFLPWINEGADMLAEARRLLEG